MTGSPPGAPDEILPVGLEPILLGIDPGLACTGWGVVRHATAAVFEYVAAGVIRTRVSETSAARLANILNAIGEIVARHQPNLAVIERVFVNQNLNSSMSLGQARGAALAALGKSNLKCFEIAPRTVKRNLTGDSRASKKIVASVVRNILHLADDVRLASDASDALAIAMGYRATTLRLRRGRR